MSAWSQGWGRVLLLLLLAALVRAGVHFIRLALLAAMGLAGMYMLHMLAQDYNKIANRPAGSRPAVAAGKALLRAITKREVHLEDNQQQDPSFGDHILRTVLMQDPRGCARKLVCQLAARGPAGLRLRPSEAAILRFVGTREADGDEAAAEFRRAHDLGKSTKDPNECSLHYRKCPLEARSVLKLLQAVG